VPRPLFIFFALDTVSFVAPKSRIITEFFDIYLPKIALLRRFPKMGSNHEKMRFWAELRADRAEQRQNGNTRTVTPKILILRCIANERERNQLGFNPGRYYERLALLDLPYQQIYSAVSPAKRKDSV